MLKQSKENPITVNEVMGNSNSKLLIKEKVKLKGKSATLSRAIILCLFLLFIGNQFYSVYFRWYNHPGPVGRGDSDFYISRINYFKDHNPFQRSKLLHIADRYYKWKTSHGVKVFYGFHGFTSSFLLGKLASAMNISAEKMFYYNFYIGVFVAGLVLLLLLNQFGTYPLNIIVGLLVFMFYTGNGHYHGFFWVVPSFYCLLLWLLTIWVFFFSSSWIFYAPFVVLGLLFSHPSSPYCIIALCVSIILNGLMEKNLAPSISKAALLLMLSVSYLAIYGALLQKQMVFRLFTGELDGIFLSGFAVPDYFVNFLLLSAISGIFFCISRHKYSFTLLLIPALLIVINFYFAYIPYSEWSLYLASSGLLLAIYEIRQISVLALANHSKTSQRNPLAFSNRSIFFIIGLIIIISYGLLFFKSPLAAAFEGIGNLLIHTPFITYFAGPLVPLTAASIYFCFARHQYKLICLLVPTFVGTIIFCFIHRTGARTFLFLEIILLFVLIYGIQQSLSLIWNNHSKISRWKELSLRSKSIFSTNLTLIVFTIGLVLWLFATRIRQDFGQKFYNPRFWQSEAMASFVREKDDSERIFLSAPDDLAFPLLGLDGWWDKKVYLPSMAPPNADLDFFKSFIFISENYKMYPFSRKGVGVFWPKTGRIILNTKGLSPGNYRIALSDTAIAPEVFTNIDLEVQQGTSFKNISTNWHKEPLVVRYPMENAYPPIMLPWYTLAAKYIEKINPGFLTVRKTLQYTMDFSLSEQAQSLCLKNHDEDLNLMGSVSILSKSQKQPIFTLDLDSAKAASLNSQAEMAFQGNTYPLLWRYPGFGLKYNGPSNKPSEALLTLDGNFGDFKVFSLFKESPQLQSDLQ